MFNIKINNTKYFSTNIDDNNDLFVKYTIAIFNVQCTLYYYILSTKCFKNGITTN